MKLTEIEAALCGMAMSDPRNLAEAISMGVTDAHFSLPLHGRIFAACRELWEKGTRTDLVTVVNRVGQEHTQDIMAIRARTPLTQNFKPYPEALLNGHRQMELHARLGDVSRLLTNRGAMEPLEPILDRLGELLVYAQGSGVALKTADMGDALRRALEATEKRVTAKGAVSVPSGIEKLDKAIYGFQPGFMYVLGARTAVGKTTLAVNMATNAALAGHKTAFITVEMADTDLVDKILQRMGRVTSQRYHMADMSAEELGRIEYASTQARDLPLVFTEVAKPSLDLLAFEMMRLVRVEKVKFIIVDYLQLFETGDANYHRTAREDAKLVSARLKMLARSLGVPILVLSQLNRQAPADGEPSLIHIAETDQIARDADCVMMLYKEKESGEDQYFLGVVKNRRGSLVSLRLHADLPLSVFHQDSQ